MDLTRRFTTNILWKEGGRSRDIMTKETIFWSSSRREAADEGVKQD